MIKNGLIFVGLGVLLTGCAADQQPIYTAHYYETHKAALQKELDFCKKADTLSGDEKKNCQTAMRVNDAQALFGGGSNKYLP